MSAPLRPALAELAAYAPEPPLGDAALDANESPFPPPAAWRRAALGILEGLAVNRYPDPAAAGLRRRVAALHRVPEASLLFGNGSDELIALLLTAFGGGDALALAPAPTFSMYRLCALAHGWRFAELPLDASWDLDDGFVEAARRLQPRLIFLATPNNPTGNALRPAAVDALAGIPGCTLVVDEAYAEFGGRSLLAAAPGRGGLVVLRTFSKAWGLAALRLGYLVARPDLVAELEKVRLPYNLGALPQALAEAALDLAPDFQARVPEILALRGRLEAALDRVPGLERFRSDANFVLARHPEAEALHAHLLSEGLRVRRFASGALAGCLRLSVGDPEQTARLESSLHSFQPQGVRR